jgi:hypothetical protein
MKKILIITMALAAQAAFGQTTITTLIIGGTSQKASLAIPTGAIVKVLNVSYATILYSGESEEIPLQVLLSFSSGATVPYGCQSPTYTANSSDNAIVGSTTWQLENQIMPLNSPLAGVTNITLQVNGTYSGDYYSLNGGFATIEICQSTNTPQDAIAMTGTSAIVTGSEVVTLQSSTNLLSWETATTGAAPFTWDDTNKPSAEFFRLSQ